MEDNQTIDWQKLILYAAGFQFIIILFLLYAAFGFVVTYGLILLIFILISIISSYLAIKQTRNIRAAEIALQYVFDRIDGLSIEIDREIKDMVWAEDVPQVRRIVELMKSARQELLNAPLLFNGTVVEEIFDPSLKDNYENEETLRKNLKGQLNEAAIEMLASEISNLKE